MSLGPELRLEHVACNFCGGLAFRLWRRIGNWTVVECRRCRFRFTNPRPTRGSLPAFYTEDYFRDERHRQSYFHADGSPLMQLPPDRYLNRVMDIEPWSEVRGTLFEIGAAHGAFLKVMRDRGWKVCGIDISPHAVSLARHAYGIDLVAATPEDFDTSERFDVVCMYQTLEHLPDPLHILRKARTWLKPQGLLVIEVPNANSLDIYTSRRQAELTLDLPRHLSHFTPPFLCAQLERLTFNILRCSLYPTAFLLTLLRWREIARAAFSPSRHPDKFSRPCNDPSLPLPRLPADTWKSRTLRWLTTAAPGWRFTVVARNNSLPRRPR